MNTLALSSGAQNGITVGVWLLISAAAIGLWLLPVFVAIRRHSPNVNQVLVVDLLLGWTFVGWVVALVMALKPLPVLYPPPYTQHGPGMPESPGHHGPGHN
jgi:RsiW-degrading membrane proteinase PrsW (M82 family)